MKSLMSQFMATCNVTLAPQTERNAHHGGGEGDVVDERRSQGGDPHHQDDGDGHALVLGHGLQSRTREHERFSLLTSSAMEVEKGKRLILTQ